MINMVPTTSSNVVMYRNKFSQSSSLVRITKEERYSLSLIKVFSQSSPHLNGLSFFSILQNGKHFSIDLDMNWDNAIIQPFNLYTSFKVIGLLIFKMALHLVGFTSIPPFVNMNMRNFPIITPNTHFIRLIQSSSSFIMIKFSSNSTK